MVDFHSHVLPYIDDGAEDVVVAAKMLDRSKRQGVNCVIATPHFHYKRSSIDEFLKKREESYKELMEYVKVNKVDIPEIRLGAEVAFSHEIMDMDIEKLKIEGTDIILVELPFTYWNDWVYKDLFELSAKHKLNVAIAHLERYIEKPKELAYIKSLFEMSILIQINADSMLERKKRKIIDNMIKNYRVDLLGTDMHGIDRRISNIDKAYKVISKRYGEKEAESLKRNSEEILKLGRIL